MKIERVQKQVKVITNDYAKTCEQHVSDRNTVTNYHQSSNHFNWFEIILRRVNLALYLISFQNLSSRKMTIPRKKTWSQERGKQRLRIFYLESRELVEFITSFSTTMRLLMATEEMLNKYDSQENSISISLRIETFSQMNVNEKRRSDDSSSWDVLPMIISISHRTQCSF